MSMSVNLCLAQTLQSEYIPGVLRVKFKDETALSVTKYATIASAQEQVLEAVPSLGSKHLHPVWKPELFASSVVMAYVSDYNLPALEALATANAEKIKRLGIPLRLEIGSEDQFVHYYGRQGTVKIHQHLMELGIEHEMKRCPGLTTFYWDCGTMKDRLVN